MSNPLERKRLIGFYCGAVLLCIFGALALGIVSCVATIAFNRLGVDVDFWQVAAASAFVMFCYAVFYPCPLSKDES